MKSAPQHRFTHPATLCRRENSQLPSFQAIPIYPPWRDSCLPRLPRASRGSSRGLPSLPRASKRAQFAKGCKNTKPATLTTFRINTCKSVSKQMTLTSFRINTYKKTGGGGYPCEPPVPRPSYAPRGASIPCALTRLRILPVATAVWGTLRLSRHSFAESAPLRRATRHFPFVFIHLRTLYLSLRSFSGCRSLFSTACGLFCQNTRGGGGGCSASSTSFSSFTSSASFTSLSAMLKSSRTTYDHP